MKRFGVSFKGGMAKGFGGIGFIRFLQEEELKPQVLAGSSAGALIAAAYALGYKWDDILKIVKSLDLKKVISFRDMVKENNLLSHDKFKEILLRFTFDIDIEELPIKLIIFATDLKHKKRVSLERGNLVEALTASAAFPFIFPAVTVGGRKLIDGELSAGYSSQELIAEGCSRVIGVTAKSTALNIPLLYKGLGHHFIDIYRTLLAQVNRMHDNSHPVDFEVKYWAGDVSLFDFGNTDKLATRAYRSVTTRRDEFMKLLK